MATIHVVYAPLRIKNVKPTYFMFSSQQVSGVIIQRNSSDVIILDAMEYISVRLLQSLFFFCFNSIL